MVETEKKFSDVLFKRLVYLMIFIFSIGFGLMIYNNSDVVSKDGDIVKIAEKSFENGVIRQYSKESDDRINLLTVINHEQELINGTKKFIVELQTKDIRTGIDIVIISGKFTDETKDNLGLSIRLSKVSQYSLDFNTYEELLDMLSNAHS